MRGSQLGTLAMLGAPLACAQTGLPGLPNCALNALATALMDSGCASTDVACVCTSQSFANLFTSGVTASCDQADQATSFDFVRGLCNAVGIASSIGNPITLSAGTSSATNPGATPISTESSISTTSVGPSSISLLQVPIPSTMSTASSTTVSIVMPASSVAAASSVTPASVMTITTSSDGALSSSSTFLAFQNTASSTGSTLVATEIPTSNGTTIQQQSTTGTTAFKVGIGVAIPVFVLALLALFAFNCRRNQRKRPRLEALAWVGAESDNFHELEPQPVHVSGPEKSYGHESISQPVHVGKKESSGHPKFSQFHGTGASSQPIHVGRSA